MARIDKKTTNLADSSDVFDAGFFVKAQIGIQSVSYVVAIEQVGQVPVFKQHFFYPIGQGRFTAATQAGKPEHARLLSISCNSFVFGYFVFMPDYVFIHLCHHKKWI
jgi:hypothetical protein